MQTSFSDLDAGACIFQEKVPIETFNTSFESTQNEQQYGTKITCTEVRKVMVIRNVIQCLSGVFRDFHLPSPFLNKNI